MKKIIATVLALSAICCVVLPQEKQAEAQVPYSWYCCDANYNHRCTMNAAYPVGSQCFCYGQGYGVVCL